MTKSVIVEMLSVDPTAYQLFNASNKEMGK